MSNNLKIEIQTHVEEDGNIKRNRQMFIDTLYQFRKKDITIIIQRRFKKRSHVQNAYYQSVVIPIVMNGLFMTGNHWDVKTVKEYLRSKFLPCERVNRITGQLFPHFKCTTELSTTEFMHYIDQIREWAYTFLGCNIPEPDPNWRQNLLKTMIDISKLTEADIDRPVIYESHPGAKLEDGIITSFNDKYIFVKYPDGSPNSKATPPDKLFFLKD